MKSQEVIEQLAGVNKRLSEAAVVMSDMELALHTDDVVKESVINYFRSVNASHKEVIKLIKHFAEDLSNEEISAVSKKVGWEKSK